MNLEEQIPIIDKETAAVDAKISDALESIYTLEEEIVRLTQRLTAKRTELRKLSKQRTEALNFRLFPAQEAS